jgi:hypothetical protein
MPIQQAFFPHSPKKNPNHLKFNCNYAEMRLAEIIAEMLAQMAAQVMQATTGNI